MERVGQSPEFGEQQGARERGITQGQGGSAPLDLPGSACPNELLTLHLGFTVGFEGP